LEAKKTAALANETQKVNTAIQFRFLSISQWQ
jgi:hypothetical protein